MKKYLYKNYKIIIIAIIVSCLLGYGTSRLLFPNYQFAISTEGGKDYISVGTVNDSKLAVKSHNGKYTIDIPYNYLNKKINITYTKENKKIKELYVNNKKTKVYKLNTYANDRYKNISLFNVEGKTKRFIFSFFVITIILSILLTAIFHNGKYKIFKNEIIKKIGVKHIIITSIVTLLSIFLICGCDAKMIINCARWFSDNVDIYQLQINSKNLLGTVYAEFPYNPISIFTYGGVFKIVSFIVKDLPLIRYYPYFQVFIIKIINLVLIQLSILNLLNYLYNEQKISEKKLRLIYYLSFFNPVTFYVAFLFVQLDALSLFLITNGIIFLNKIKENNYIGVLLISLGIVIKTQLLVFLPIILLALVIYSFPNNKFINGLKKYIFSMVIFITIVMIFYGFNLMFSTPYYLLSSNLQQAERLYYTVINYMGTTNVYITIFSVGLIVFSFAFNLKEKINKNNLTKAILLYLLALIYILSATIVPTPSIYVLSLPAFIVLMYDEKDYLRILLLTIMSFGVIVLPMFSDYGDVTILLSGFNNKSLLMNYISNLETENLIKFNNIIFTVSVSTMFAYTIYSIKNAIKLMEGKNE